MLQEKQHKQTNYARRGDLSSGLSAVSRKEMLFFMKNPLLTKLVRSRLLNIVNNMDIYGLNCVFVHKPVKRPISNQLDH